MAPRLEIIQETGSTNADLLARISAGGQLAEGQWLIADRQTQGRGRQGRQWLDAPGNFMGSTLVRLDPKDPAPASLSFLTALAVYASVSGRIAQPSQLQLKWPNDVLLAGTKFCGILLEREGDCAVVGIGVNLAAAPKLNDRETLSLAQSGASVDRDLFAQDLAANFATELVRWRQYGTGPMFKRWQAAAHKLGTRLSVHNDKGQIMSGTYQGLEPDGALRLCLEDGTHHVIHAGDVTLEAG